jgi:hypothetical protein
MTITPSIPIGKHKQDLSRGNGGKSGLKKSAGEFEFEKGHNLRNNGCHLVASNVPYLV